MPSVEEEFVIFLQRKPTPDTWTLTNLTENWGRNVTEKTIWRGSSLTPYYVLEFIDEVLGFQTPVRLHHGWYEFCLDGFFIIVQGVVFGGIKIGVG